jgi:hypothetical protein
MLAIWPKGAIMLSESQFEIEKRRGAWRVTARGYPALAFAVAFGFTLAAVMAWTLMASLRQLH